MSANPTQHPEGQPYSTYTYNKGCRCDGCKLVKKNYRLAKLGRLEETDPVPVDGPKRPPGWCWIDDSGITCVVRCERCQKNYGPWVLHKQGAEAFADEHRQLHAAEPPFNWGAWGKERLVKNPGGRPPLEDKPLCTYGDCTEDAHAKALCMKHYKRSLRGGLYE